MQPKPTKGVAIFEQRCIRRIWHDERWYFAVVDVIAALTDSSNPGQYWRTLKSRLASEGGDETVTKRNTFKMRAADGKLRDTDCADTETLLRIIQSIPSPKAEPFKQWLAQVGRERIAEADDPESSFEEWRRRAVNSYMAKGHDREWSEARVESIITRTN